MMNKIVEKFTTIWTMIMIVVTIACTIGEDEHKILCLFGCIVVWAFLLCFVLLIFTILRQSGMLVSRTVDNVKWKHRYNRKLFDSLIYENEIKEIKILAFATWTLFIIGLLLLSFPNAEDNISFISKCLAVWIAVIGVFFAISKFVKFLRLKHLKGKLDKEINHMNELKEQKTKVEEKLELSYVLQEEINKANELSKIVNTTTSREEFYSGLEEIKKILRHLSEYEGVVDFEFLPSDNLNEIEENESEQIRLLEERIRQKNLGFDKKDNIDSMEGHDFERYCADLLKKLGYTNVSVTPGSGDQGIDVLAQKEGIKYGIQCKCYSSDIGNKAVQEAFSGAKFYDCHVPVVLTNRYFTKSARELAEKANVVLWDRDKLNKMINEVQRR